MNDHTSVFLRVKVCQKWLIIIIPICPSLPSLPGPSSCIIIFQVPGEEPKSLYLPLANSSSLTYESCSEYLDPSDHSQGTTVCSQGYEFQFEGENEWTITAEVSKALYDAGIVLVSLPFHTRLHSQCCIMASTLIHLGNTERYFK